MKKKWLTKVLSTALTGMMVLTLASCGSSPSKESSAVKESSAGSSVAESSIPAASSTETEEVTGPGSITYPLDTDITLSYWGGAPFSDAYQSWTESPAHNSFIEAVGVDIDFQYVAAGADKNQAYNLLLADEEMPDMIYHFVNPADGADLITDGIIYDLTEYLPKYAPDFWAFIHEPEQEIELKSILTADGAFYMLPTMYESGYGPTYMGPIIRQDWLKECGLEVPVTLEDWERVLGVFKDKYNAKFGANLGYFKAEGFASGTGALGFLGSTVRINENGEAVLVQAEEAWKELMVIMNRWWEMGLIDEDSLTMGNDVVRNKILNGEIGATFVPLSQMTNIINDAENEGIDSEWISVSYPRTAAGEATSMIQSLASRTTGGGVIFTTDCTEEELAVALKLWNYAYTEEGMKFLGFGKEGEVHTVDAEGNIFWVDKIANAELGIDYESRKYSMWANSMIPGMLPDRLVQLKNKEVVAAAPYTWIENTKAPEHCMPSVALTEAENLTVTTYLTPITTYVEEEALKFLTGSRSLDEWEDFVKTLEGMGLQDVEDAYQAAYDRFMGN